ncbi:hypothetical protein HYV50_05690 [Candidatus Pacearchaeota archaeon]|nr:hypothetical protein [Candidatus Pacearchaeota archaeon]
MKFFNKKIVIVTIIIISLTIIDFLTFALFIGGVCPEIRCFPTGKFSGCCGAYSM